MARSVWKGPEAHSC